MKTKLTIEQVRDFLMKEFGMITGIQQMVEGEESQALSFAYQGGDYVIRINPSMEGFKKDGYAYKCFAAPAVPIPKVIQMGQLDKQHAFCVSEYATGVTFQDADEATIERLLVPVTNVWRAIGTTNISRTTGYGDFTITGQGPFHSWKDYLLSILDYDWAKIDALIDKPLVARLAGEFKILVVNSPEERKLVHGDFGSNNLLVNDSEVTSVIDWENALYGDPLFDVAGAYFWRKWLRCMEKSAQYWEKELASMPNYHQRIRCYQLRTGLREIHDNAMDGDIEMLGWLQNRSMEILSES